MAGGWDWLLGLHYGIGGVRNASLSVLQSHLLSLIQLRHSSPFLQTLGTMEITGQGSFTRGAWWSGPAARS
jgi:hypothetical protein